MTGLSPERIAELERLLTAVVKRLNAQAKTLRQTREERNELAGLRQDAEMTLLAAETDVRILERERERLREARNRLNGLHEALRGALVTTKPPDAEVLPYVSYSIDIKGEPYAWLVVLVSEALVAFPPALCEGALDG